MTSDIQAQAVDWAIRLHDGDLMPEEALALDRWLAQDAGCAEALRKARRLLGDADAVLISDPAFTKRLLRRRRAGNASLLSVAFLVLLAGGGALAWPDGWIWLRADVISAASQMPVVTLPDGSRVQLNGRSAIAEHFSATGRRLVLLRGEAYFEVAADPARPFVVEAGGGTITVTGTAFDVNLVDGGVTVAVTEHTVSVASRASEAAAQLGPGQAVFLDAAGSLGRVVPLPAEMAAPWRGGRLVFDGQRLSSVLEQIFRHMPGRVVVARPSVADRLVSGSFDLSDPPAALASFGKVFGLRIIRAGDLLTVIY